MTTPAFRYGDIKTMMNRVFNALDEAGYSEEAKAMASLTHIIGSRIEAPNLSSKWGVEYMIECIEHQDSLLKYINDGAIDGNQT